MGDAQEKLTGGERLMLQLLHLIEKIRLGVMLASLCLLWIQSPLWVQLAGHMHLSQLQGKCVFQMLGNVFSGFLFGEIGFVR